MYHTFLKNITSAHSLTQGFSAEIRHHDHKTMGEGKGFFQLLFHITTHHQKKSGTQPSRAETWGRNWCRGHGGGCFLAFSHPWLAQPPFIACSTSSPRVVPLQQAGASHTPARLTTGQADEAFSQLNVFPSSKMTLACVTLALWTSQHTLSLNLWGKRKTPQSRHKFLCSLLF